MPRESLYQSAEEELEIYKINMKYPDGLYNDNISPEIDKKDKGNKCYYVRTYSMTNEYSMYECPLARIV